MFQLDYTPNQHFSSYLRYKGKEKDEESRQHRFRWQATYLLDDSWKLRTSADGIVSANTEESDKGYMISQSVGWKPIKHPLQLDTYIAWFATDNYATRISRMRRIFYMRFTCLCFMEKDFG